MGEEKAPHLFCTQRFSVGFGYRDQTLQLTREARVVSHFWLPNGPAVIGITAGASCPNNLIEETLIRLFELRGISRHELELAA